MIQGLSLAIRIQLRETAMDLCRSGVLVAISCLMASSPALSQAAPAAAANRHDADIVKAFETRVKGYMDLRKKEAGTSPKPTSSTTKLAETREQMAVRIRGLRSNAHQGDIFTPEIADYFHRQIAATLNGPDGQKIRASLKHAEPQKGWSPQINQQYPERAPLQSTPPSFLLNLPRLPKELEYRIVGKDLVLRDTAPNVIVDFIPNVLPNS